MPLELGVERAVSMLGGGQELVAKSVQDMLAEKKRKLARSEE